MAVDISALVRTLSVRVVDEDVFEGTSPPSSWWRVYGGQVVGQALLAAGHTVQGPPPHSLHAYFVLAGDPAVPIRYEVERVRDGRSFATRRVAALQGGRTIFALMASFHGPEQGFTHQVPMPDTPPPEACPGPPEILAGAIPAMTAAARDYYARERTIEIRLADVARFSGPRPVGEPVRIWFRAAGRLPDDADLQRAAIAYASDLSILDTALVPHGMAVQEDAIQAASLDHALWFHADARADEWLLYVQDSHAASDGLGLARGLIFDRGGRLIATAMQEGLLRPRRFPRSA